MYDGGNPFPHDGEHGRSCSGYGCDCDEKNYGYHGGGSSGGGSGAGIIFLIAVAIASAVGVFNQLLGVIILVVVGFILLINRW